ncbi:MAG TPA: DinB family protein [Candidatus Micrarchaeaceae archaeon]|nr:DinB family protein [Candidatus Micrarchaeaceae archaeon]
MYVSAVPKGERLADLEAARQRWEAAFAEVPDEALAYLKPGDDYALGGLQVHVNWVLVHYRRVLDGLVDRGFTPLPPLDPPGENAEFNKRAKAGLDRDSRRLALADMASVHKAVVETANQVPDESWSRKTPVTYGVGQDPYPTSPDDVIGWLADHYREHVQQCPELVADWRKTL